ncbi:DUF6286 domain-containing protein [Streptomyces sp. NPDC020875]|uniref:DUF6286 domain-containing protein n=1 Tax=Streptomyces sp. NPDC020875 TaxID=3154898 RepID=UPI0033FDE41A
MTPPAPANDDTPGGTPGPRHGPQSRTVEPGPGSGAATPEPPGSAAAKARRPWSARRVPAGLLALVVLGGAGILLYDIAAVRADRPAMAWRRTVADDLATRPLDDPWTTAVAAVAVAVGLWLLLLALTPGLRALLPMRREADPAAPGPVRAALAREAAALYLRDQALEVPGVQSVRVRVGRRKASVRARSHFRDLDDVHTDLDTALAGAVGELGLAKPPVLSVRVARPPRKKR